MATKKRSKLRAISQKLTKHLYKGYTFSAKINEEANSEYYTHKTMKPILNRTCKTRKIGRSSTRRKLNDLDNVNRPLTQKGSQKCFEEILNIKSKKMSQKLLHDYNLEGKETQSRRALLHAANTSLPYNNAKLRNSNIQNHHCSIDYDLVNNNNKSKRPKSNGDCFKRKRKEFHCLQQNLKMSREENRKLGDGKWNSQAGIKFMSKTPFSERIMNEQRTLNQFSYERSQLSTFTSNENLILQDCMERFKKINSKTLIKGPNISDAKLDSLMLDTKIQLQTLSHDIHDLVSNSTKMHNSMSDLHDEKKRRDHLYASDSRTFESPSKNFIVCGQKIKKISFCSRKVMDTLNKDMLISQDEINKMKMERLIDLILEEPKARSELITDLKRLKKKKKLKQKSRFVKDLI